MLEDISSRQNFQSCLTKNYFVTNFGWCQHEAWPGEGKDFNMAIDAESRLRTLKVRRSEVRKQLLIWSIAIAIPLVICLILGSYYENHLTFEEAYLNESSQRSDIAYGIGLFLMALGCIVVLVLAMKNNVIEKEIAEVDRIQANAQQADLIGAAVKSYDNRPPTPEHDSNNRLAQLERIGRLLADGIVSQEEFDRLKAELLA